MLKRSNEFGAYDIVEPATPEELAQLIRYSIETREPVIVSAVPQDRTPAPAPKPLSLTFDNIISIPDEESQPQSLALGWLGERALSHDPIAHDALPEWAIVNLSSNPPRLTRPTNDPPLWLVPMDAA